MGNKKTIEDAIALAKRVRAEGADLFNSRSPDLVADELAAALLQVMPLRTKTVVLGEAAATETARALVRESKWFTVTPLPDGEYSFTVKAE